MGYMGYIISVPYLTYILHINVLSCQNTHLNFDFKKRIIITSITWNL